MTERLPMPAEAAVGVGYLPSETVAMQARAAQGPRCAYALQCGSAKGCMLSTGSIYCATASAKEPHARSKRKGVEHRCDVNGPPPRAWRHVAACQPI